MKVLLIDADSTIPNLALMKLSAWHKSQGNSVSFSEPEPDLIYALVVFKKNTLLLSGLQLLYPDAKIEIGGSGYDLKEAIARGSRGGLPRLFALSRHGLFSRIYFEGMPEPLLLLLGSKEGRLVPTMALSWKVG